MLDLSPGALFGTEGTTRIVDNIEVDVLTVVKGLD